MWHYHKDEADVQGDASYRYLVHHIRLCEMQFWSRQTFHVNAVRPGERAANECSNVLYAKMCGDSGTKGISMKHGKTLNTCFWISHSIVLGIER